MLYCRKIASNILNSTYANFLLTHSVLGNFWLSVLLIYNFINERVFTENENILKKRVETSLHYKTLDITLCYQYIKMKYLIIKSVLE